MLSTSSYICRIVRCCNKYDRRFDTKHLRGYAKKSHRKLPVSNRNGFGESELFENHQNPNAPGIGDVYGMIAISYIIIFSLFIYPIFLYFIGVYSVMLFP